jgi:hypothetical protein
MEPHGLPRAGNLFLTEPRGLAFSRSTAVALAEIRDSSPAGGHHETTIAYTVASPAETALMRR